MGSMYIEPNVERSLEVRSKQRGRDRDKYRCRLGVILQVTHLPARRWRYEDYLCPLGYSWEAPGLDDAATITYNRLLPSRAA